MIRDHKFYEKQSALAATGLLGGSELAELEKHASDCVSCRAYMVDMVAISRGLFLAHAERARLPKAPQGMRDRFLQRAIAAGIAVRSGTSCWVNIDFNLARTLAISMFFLIFITLGWRSAIMTQGEPLVLSDRLTSPSPPAVVMQENSQPIGLTTAPIASKGVRRSLRRANLQTSVSTKRLPIPLREGGSPAHALFNVPIFSRQVVSANFSGISGLAADSMAQRYLGAAIHLPNRSAFETPMNPINFAGKWHDGPEKRLFRFDVGLTSISRLTPTLNASAVGRLPGLRISTPIFHLETSQSW